MHSVNHRRYDIQIVMRVVHMESKINKTEKCPEINKKEALKGELVYMKLETWKENRSGVVKDDG